MKNVISSTASFAVLFAVSIALCHGAVIHVPADQPTVQAGLNVAEPGDIVLVAEGVYTENLVWPATPDITLLGDGMPESVVLDGSLVGRVITIPDEDSEPVLIVSVTIRNGWSSQDGGGVSAFRADLCMLDCIITQNRTSLIASPGYECHGGGIYSESNILRLYNCTITDNHTNCYGMTGNFHFGGGIYASGLIAVNCMVTDNTIMGDHSYGGGMYLGYGEITNCLITGNSASSYGGMVQSLGFIRSSTVTNNENIDFGILWTPEVTTVMDSCIAGTVGFSSPPETHIEMNYTCFGSADPSVVIGPGSFSVDPMFVTGPKGNYYLSNTAAGQAGTSPCVDTGNPALTSSGTGSTRTDHVSDTGIIDMGFHYAYQVLIPSPTPVPTETPTPSPTPECDQTGVSVLVEPGSVDPGETISVMLEICNTKPDTLGPVRLYFALEIYESLFFWPTWSTDYDFELITLDPGLTQMVMFNFVWPATGTTGNATFIGLMTNETGTAALGTGAWRDSSGNSCYDVNPSKSKSLSKSLSVSVSVSVLVSVSKSPSSNPYAMKSSFPQ